MRTALILAALAIDVLVVFWKGKDYIEVTRLR
jgi:hypothetical protein